MRTSTFFAGLLAAGFSVASPVQKRVSTPKVNDGIILNYALTLGMIFLDEHIYNSADVKNIRVS